MEAPKPADGEFKCKKKYQKYCDKIQSLFAAPSLSGSVTVR